VSDVFLVYAMLDDCKPLYLAIPSAGGARFTRWPSSNILVLVDECDAVAVVMWAEDRYELHLMIEMRDTESVNFGRLVRAGDVVELLEACGMIGRSD
jgi:hypothetical protein